VIPPEHNGSFVANMEMVLDVYKRPFDPRYPVVCMDESRKATHCRDACLCVPARRQEGSDFRIAFDKRPSMTMNTSVAVSAIFSLLASHWQEGVW